MQHTLHNQFLTCLYAGPQDINLFDLFYNGVGTWEAPSQAELEQLGVLAEDGSQICPTYKLTTGGYGRLSCWKTPA